MNVLGNQDSWDCDANTTGSNKNLSYYCTETRSQINCKTVSGPLKVNNNIKHQNYIFSSYKR